MAALTDNKYDVYKWVKKVIDSCKTLDHINSAERLVERFKIQSIDWYLYRKLSIQLTVKIHLIKKKKK
jgi:hypothetical protein